MQKLRSINLTALTLVSLLVQVSLPFVGSVTDTRLAALFCTQDYERVSPEFKAALTELYQFVGEPIPTGPSHDGTGHCDDCNLNRIDLIQHNVEHLYAGILYTTDTYRPENYSVVYQFHLLATQPRAPPQKEIMI